MAIHMTFKFTKTVEKNNFNVKINLINLLLM